MEEIRARVDAIVEDPRHRRGAQALVPAVLQAPVLPRRVSPDVQPPERDARRHAREGRRADHGEGRRGRRPRVPARLPDLRDRLRGRHRLLAPLGLRHRRARRPHAHREVGRRRAHVPRPAHPRLPELLHDEHRAVGLHRELPVRDRSPGAAHRLSRRARAARGDRRARGDAAGRGRLGRDGRRAWATARSSSPSSARPATTTPRASRRESCARARSSSARRPSSPSGSRRGAPTARLQGLETRRSDDADRGAHTSPASARRVMRAGGRSATSPSTRSRCEAIQRAVADAGLTIDDVDGLASFADDRNEAIYLAAELGLPALRFANMVWLPGGGGGCAAVGERRDGGGDGPGRGGGGLPLAVPGPVLPLRHGRPRRDRRRSPSRRGRR